LDAGTNHQIETLINNIEDAHHRLNYQGELSEVERSTAKDKYESNLATIREITSQIINATTG